MRPPTPEEVLGLAAAGMHGMVDAEDCLQAESFQASEMQVLEQYTTGPIVIAIGGQTFPESMVFLLLETSTIHATGWRQHHHRVILSPAEAMLLGTKLIAAAADPAHDKR